MLLDKFSVDLRLSWWRRPPALSTGVPSSAQLGGVGRHTHACHIHATLEHQRSFLLRIRLPPVPLRPFPAMTLPRKNSDVVRDGCRRYDRKVVPVFSTVTVVEAAGQGTTEPSSSYSSGAISSERLLCTWGHGRSAISW